MKTGKKDQETNVKRLTPGETIRAYCLHCVGGNAQDVRACDANDPKYHVCPFHPYRLGKGRPSVKTIRKFCLQCMGNHADFVLDCETTDCLCHPYRLGKNPAYQGKGASAEQMEAIRPQKAPFIQRSNGKFERSPLAPTPTLPRGEKRNLSAESAVSGKSSPGDQAPDPSGGREARQRDRKPVKGEQISLFSPGGIHNPYPGGKRQISSQKHT